MHCKEELKPKAKFCSHCGKRQVSAKKCVNMNCLRMVDPSQKFCAECGSPQVELPDASLPPGLGLEHDVSMSMNSNVARDQNFTSLPYMHEYQTTSSVSIKIQLY